MALPLASLFRDVFYLLNLLLLTADDSFAEFIIHIRSSLVFKLKLNLFVILPILHRNPKFSVQTVLTKISTMSLYPSLEDMKVDQMMQVTQVQE